eukprot:5117207-Alexandrium_andersonii.AAC.1
MAGRRGLFALALVRAAPAVGNVPSPCRRDGTGCPANSGLSLHDVCLGSCTQFEKCSGAFGQGLDAPQRA